jgi:phenylalanyl-tRNA synthetase beta chain
VPFWRTDIHIAEDIIEEVGRLSGFDNIAPILPLHATADPNTMFGLKTQIRNHLSARGANEVLTYSFVHGDLMQKVGQKTDNAYKIVNSISPDLQYIRQSIIPSLLDKSYGNLRAGHERFAMFEMNQVYPRNLGVDGENVPLGRHDLGFLFVDQSAKSNYYVAKKYLESLLASLNISYEIVEFTENETNTYYEPKRSATIKSKDCVIGYIGEIKRRVLRDFKLPAGVAAFELELAQLLISEQGVNTKDFRISDYPSVSRDLTLTVAADANYAKIESAIRAVLEPYIYSLHPTSIYQADGGDTKNVSFHLEFAASDKTLTKAEIQGIMKQLEAIK